MPIEFRCDQCQRLLRVPDQNAGARARCPQCSHVQQVPPSSTTGHDAPQAPQGYQPTSGAAGGAWPGVQPSGAGNVTPTSTNPFAEVPEHNPFSDNPYQSPYAGGYPGGVSSREYARGKVRAPAIAVIVVAVLGSGMLLLGTLGGLIELAEGGANGEAISTFVMFGFCLLLEAVVIIGMVRMLALKNYGLALTAAIVSMLCGLCSLITLPFSIWALVVLCDNDVRSQFT